MAIMYYDQDANLELLAGKKVAVIGYGSQPHYNRLSDPLGNGFYRFKVTLGCHWKTCLYGIYS
jgi:hypothetical protein